MLKDLNDYELLELATENEEAKELLYNKYKPLVIKEAQKMYNKNPNCGLDINDFIQEGMYGLLKATENYKENKGSLFYTYAKKCILYSLQNSVTKVHRQKNIPLNNALSLEKGEETQNYAIYSAIKENSESPECVVTDYSNVREILFRLNNELTPLEAQVFELKQSGFENDEISIILGIRVKQIYNAMHRIKLKLKGVRKKIKG